jgi:hypothetical protein
MYYYSFILILHGVDNIYNEVIGNVIGDYGQQKIDQKEIQYPTVQSSSRIICTTSETQ